MPTILVLDDEASIRQTIEAVLKRAGHRLVSFAQLAPARELHRSGSVLIDLFLLDINLRGETTTAWVEELRDRGECVITISGISQVDGVVNLKKPFSITELRDTVAMVLAT